MRPHRRSARASSGTIALDSDLVARITLAVLVAACALMGGSSRVDAPLLALLRGVAAAAFGIAIALPGGRVGRDGRIVLTILGGFALLMLVQLIPLPPAIWRALPRREAYDAAAALGGDEWWRPISLTPDLTLNSLLALVPSAAALLLVVRTIDRPYRFVLNLWIAAVALSVVVGLLQISGGDDSPFYIYPLTHHGFAVGLLSNRNHQAAWLAASFPIVAVWGLLPEVGPLPRRWRRIVAAALGGVMLPALLLTGSRTGLLLGGIGLATAAVLWATRLRSSERRRPIPRIVWLGAGAAIAVALLFVVFGRALAVDRLLGIDYEGDLRVVNTPTTLRMLVDLLPVGSGFGSFDPVFRGYETDAMLRNTYFNHAHNDLLELLAVAGVGGAIVLGAFLLWWGRAAWRLWRRTVRGGGATAGLTAGAAAAIMLLASLTDYPLRTPLIGVIFALACGLLARGGDAPEARSDRAHSGANL